MSYLDDRQAGDDEIEVTPAMVGAGVVTLRSLVALDIAGPLSAEEDIVTRLRTH